MQGGQVAAARAGEYVKGLTTSAESVSSKFFDQQVKKEEEKNDELLRMRGKENPYQIWEEMGRIMTDNVTVVRHNKKLEETDRALQELIKKMKDLNMNDASKWVNQTLVFTRQLLNMLPIARVITLGALARNESRGAHYKPDFPNRDDANWLKTTVAKWTPNGPQLSYEPVDTSLLMPRERKY